MLINKRDSHIKALPSYAEIKKFNFNFRHKSMKEANAKLKKKFRPFSDFIELQFNPSSNNHIRELFYTQLDYEPIDFTDSGEPATGAKTLTKLLKVATIDSHKELLEHLIENNKTSKILNTFIKAFKNYEINGYLHGDLKLGGTQSGRLSSSKPNLQNLPSNSTYGKDIKSCFVAPKGYLWAGADFASLEDRINAILTQDPNKIKVYTDGYDGHCLRAYSYFGNQMPDIKNTVDSINSIETKYPELRQKSKGPTFALTYNGTWHTLVSNIGIPIDEAKQIEKNYHKLYAVSDKFTETQIAHATKHGYMECAFGLQIKTPILASSIYGSTVTPYAVTAEARSANNAVTQSWGMLINRALIATNKLIEQSEFVYDIYPINTIHDAAYFLVKDTPEAISFLNKILIKEMQWNEHPLIQSKDVLMEADLEIGKSWDKQTSIPNNASITQIEEILSEL
jgi:DNA polymerase-1